MKIKNGASLDLINSVLTDDVPGEVLNRLMALRAFASEHPPTIGNEQCVALVPFLEIGKVPELLITGNHYVDAGIFLDKNGFEEEGAIIVSLRTSKHLALFMDQPPPSYFVRRKSNPITRAYLTYVDSSVGADGSVVHSISERAYTEVVVYGRGSPQANSWIMSLGL